MRPINAFCPLILWFGIGIQSATIQESNSIRWATVLERSTSEGPGAYLILGAQKEIVARLSLEIVHGPGVLGVEDNVGKISVAVAQDGRVLPTSVDLIFLKRPDGGILTVNDYAEIRLAIRRTDQALFSPGLYSVRTEMKTLFASLQLPDGFQWQGRFRQSETKEVRIKSAVTSQELAEVHRVAGNEELSAGQLELAIQHLEQAVNLQPEDWGTQYALGAAYSRQQRYERAVEAFRRALPGWRRFPERRDDLPNHLARALLALRRDSEAIAELQAAGVPAAQIPERISRLRATLNLR